MINKKKTTKSKPKPKAPAKQPPKDSGASDSRYPSGRKLC